MRHERCSADESDSYPWIGYHRSPIRRGACLALVSWINRFRFAFVAVSRIARIVVRSASPDRSMFFVQSCGTAFVTVLAIAQTKPASSRATATHTLLI